MTLFLPPAVSINRFVGGFKSKLSYTDLAETETNDAQNTEYGPDADISQRKGSQKLYNTKLTSLSATEGRPITGYYYFDKLGATAVAIAAAGDSLFSYSSATATRIRTGLNDNSASLWEFVQIQDMRSASNDIVCMTNGVDPIQIWDGTNSAVALSSVTSATGVPICKYLLQHKNLNYAANIVDATDVDSPVKVVRSEIGTDGAPNPHRFVDTFYVGGSSRDGELTGQKLLNDQIIYYTRNSIWRFIPGLGDVNDLEQVNSNIGLLAPKSLISTGNLHIFLSQRGVFSFDGNTVTHLSKDVDDIIFEDANQSLLKNAVAEFDYERNQYILYFPDLTKTRNDLGLKFDIRLLAWQPLIRGREVSIITTYEDTDRRTKTIYGDYMGYIYADGVNANDGIVTGFNGTIVSATLSVLDVTASLPTDNDGLGGLRFEIISGTAEGQSRNIVSNTSSTITLETPLGVQPDATSVYTIGSIDSYWKSKEYDFTGHDINKLFRYISLRLREEGDRNLNVYYIIDFRKLNRATLKLLNMFKDAWVWGKSVWGTDSWGRRQSFSKRISLRNTPTQSTNGTHLAIRFGNRRANEEYKVNGMDIEFNQTGKR